MDSLVSSLSAVSLGGGVKKLSGTLTVYISEVSSPTRLWIQDVSSPYWKKLKDMVKFYEQKPPYEFALNEQEVKIGMKVLAYACGEWCRAEVIGNVNNSKKVRLFFFDYGTIQFVPLANCKMLIEEFAVIPRQAYRAALSGIRPVGNVRLWNLQVSEDFVAVIKNKIHKIEIVKYHAHEDFYEFLLFDGDGSTINHKLVEGQAAEAVWNSDQPPLCLFYPSFYVLEKLVVYPTLSDRYTMLHKHGIDFNVFEERNIAAVTTIEGFEMELRRLMRDPNFEEVKKVLKKYYSVNN